MAGNLFSMSQLVAFGLISWTEDAGHIVFKSFSKAREPFLREEGRAIGWAGIPKKNVYSNILSRHTHISSKSKQKSQMEMAETKRE